MKGIRHSHAEERERNRLGEEKERKEEREKKNIFEIKMEWYRKMCSKGLKDEWKMTDMMLTWR